jgi:hypothetical protein
MTIPKRISVKFYAVNPEVVQSPAFIPVFQRWIQRHSVEGVLIDVAHYQHVHEGPGLLLISHEGDYAYDLVDGRPGVSYTRKTPAGATLGETLREVFRLALIAAQKLEAEKKLGGLRFDVGEAKISFIDRLRTPNTPETFDALREPVDAVLGDLYGAPVTLDAAHPDPREVLAIRADAAAPVTAASLLERLAVPVT